MFLFFLIVLSVIIFISLKRCKQNTCPSECSKIKSEKYVVIDIETTGLNYYNDEIVELSALKIENNVVIDEFNTLVKPSGKMSEKASKINHITDDMLKNAPAINEVLQDFVNFCDCLPVVAHNSSFDLTFICRDCRIYNIDFNPKYIDTLELARETLTLYNYKLQTVAEHFNIQVKNQHRALDDCYTLFECYKKMRKVKPSKFFLNLDMSKVHIKTDVSKIVANQEITHNVFNGKKCVITGDLRKYERTQAMQVIANHGGICQKNVTKETGLLIVGTDAGATKLNKAKEKIAKGQDLQIISEDEFYNLINE